MVMKKFSHIIATDSSIVYFWVFGEHHLILLGDCPAQDNGYATMMAEQLA